MKDARARRFDQHLAGLVTVAIIQRFERGLSAREIAADIGQPLAQVKRILAYMSGERERARVAPRYRAGRLAEPRVVAVERPVPLPRAPLAPTIEPFPQQPPRPRLTFEEQLAAVRNGARLVEVAPLRRPGPDITLGGVGSGLL